MSGRGRPPSRQTPVKKAFAAGYACAIAGLARDHGEDQLALFLLDDSGIRLEDFECSGVDEYDLNEIRNLLSPR